MNFLIVGLCLFFALHLIPSLPVFRSQLIAKLGVGPYKGLYSLLSLMGFGLIVYGYSIADFHSLWKPLEHSRIIAKVLMVFSIVLLVSTYVPSNIKRIVRHPMLLGVIFWSISHLLANGDFASALLFGSFGVFSLVSIVSSNRRNAKVNTKRYPVKMDIITLLLGLCIYSGIMYTHGYVIGVPLV